MIKATSVNTYPGGPAEFAARRELENMGAIAVKIGIIGYGHVGKYMHQIFKDAVVYDKILKIGSIEDINKCDIGFVCVPTPQLPDGHCDTSIVREVIGWLETAVIVIRSTVYIGFTDEISLATNKRVVFQPEYYGETTAHPFAVTTSRQWLSFGGKKEDIALVVKAYKQVYNSEIRLYFADARTVEMAKYMENSFLALKVTFCNEIFDLCQAMGIDYNQVREIWLADPRMGRSHTFVYEDERGYGGKCLPKDISSFIAQGNDLGVNVSLLEAMVNRNSSYKK